MTYVDSAGNTFTYDQNGMLVAVAAGTSADPFNINVGGYATTLEQIAPGITAKMTATAQPGESWLTTLTKLIPAVTMTAQQYQLMQINIDRASKGLPAIDVASYSGAGVNVGLAPDTQKLLMYGGLAILAAYLLKGRKS
jgi:hypothetical protein